MKPKRGSGVTHDLQEGSDGVGEATVTEDRLHRRREAADIPDSLRGTGFTKGKGTGDGLECTFRG